MIWTFQGMISTKAGDGTGEGGVASFFWPGRRVVEGLAARPALACSFLPPGPLPHFGSGHRSPSLPSNRALRPSPRGSRLPLRGHVGSPRPKYPRQPFAAAPARPKYTPSLSWRTARQASARPKYTSAEPAAGLPERIKYPPPAGRSGLSAYPAEPAAGLPERIKRTPVRLGPGCPSTPRARGLMRVGSA